METFICEACERTFFLKEFIQEEEDIQPGEDLVILCDECSEMAKILYMRKIDVA